LILKGKLSSSELKALDRDKFESIEVNLMDSEIIIDTKDPSLISTLKSKGMK